MILVYGIKFFFWFVVDGLFGCFGFKNCLSIVAI